MLRAAVPRAAAGLQWDVEAAGGEERASRFLLEAEKPPGAGVANLAGRARAVHRAARRLLGAAGSGPRAAPFAAAAAAVASGAIDARAPPPGALRWACAAPEAAAWVEVTTAAAAAGEEGGGGGMRLCAARGEASALRLLPVSAAELAIVEHGCSVGKALRPP